MKTSKRIDDLLEAMTLEEKLGQLNMLSAAGDSIRTSENAGLVEAVARGQAGSVLNLVGAHTLRETQDIALKQTRLGIPLLFCFDVVHGYRTIFPIPLGEAASFDENLWQQTARCAAEEASADGIGLTFAPMLDVCRDPRWGRIAEGPGEDPWLAQKFATAKVRGFQSPSNDLRAKNAVAATAKHIGAYGAVNAGRDYASVDISEHMLHEVYLPPFKAAVDADVAAIMPAFVDVAGIPISAHHAMLTQLVRHDWGFDGVYISDYHAIAELINHGIAADLTHAAAAALRAGMDIDMMSFAYINHLPAALAQGLVSIDDIDNAVRRVLHLKEKLGLFDDPYRQTPMQMPTPASRTLARQAAQKAIVVLKNDAGLLPLHAEGCDISVLVTSTRWDADALGSWSGAGEVAEISGFEENLRAALPQRHIHFHSIDDDTPIEALLKTIQNHLLLVCVGERSDMSGEAASRAHLGLCARDDKLLAAVHTLGLPAIVLMACGRPLIAHERYKASSTLVVQWFLGIEAGPALADVLTGAVDACGRLPLSWPRAIGQIPLHYAQKPSGRPYHAQDFFTSKYIDESNDPDFWFGHGLSYTQFETSEINCSHRSEKIILTINVKNIGPRKGQKTLFLFMHHASSSRARPKMELRGVKQIVIDPQHSAAVEFMLSENDLGQCGDDLRFHFEGGMYDFYIGASAEPSQLKQCRVNLSKPLPKIHTNI